VVVVVVVVVVGGGAIAGVTGNSSFNESEGFLTSGFGSSDGDDCGSVRSSGMRVEVESILLSVVVLAALLVVVLGVVVGVRISPIRCDPKKLGNPEP